MAEPLARRPAAGRARTPYGGTALGASLLVAMVGTAAVLAIQTRANADLRTANLDLATPTRSSSGRTPI